jgi:hypothetical protein
MKRRSNGKDNSRSEIQGFFLFDYAQGQNDDVKTSDNKSKQLHPAGWEENYFPTHVAVRLRYEWGIRLLWSLTRDQRKDRAVGAVFGVKRGAWISGWWRVR